MICINCGGKTSVVNSRPQKRLNKIWRRRECENCHLVFTTIESIDYSGTWRVAQHDDSLAEFSRDRLFTSVYDSCKHRESAINDATWLTDTIITKLTKSLGSAFLTRDLIASITYETLARFDKVAAVYYRAFHKI